MIIYDFNILKYNNNNIIIKYHNFIYKYIKLNLEKYILQNNFITI